MPVSLRLPPLGRLTSLDCTPRKRDYPRPVGVAYPAHLEADVVLRDGSTVHLHPVRADDEGALLELFERLAPDSRMFRFFSAATDLKSTARLMADVDYAGRYGLVRAAARTGA